MTQPGTPNYSQLPTVMNAVFGHTYSVRMVPDPSPMEQLLIDKRILEKERIEKERLGRKARLLDTMRSNYTQEELEAELVAAIEKLLDECAGQEGFLAFDGYDDWDVSFHVGFIGLIPEPDWTTKSADGTPLTHLNWQREIESDQIKVQACWLKREGERGYLDMDFSGSVFVPPRKLTPAAREIYQTFRTDGMEIDQALATAEACAA